MDVLILPSKLPISSQSKSFNYIFGFILKSIIVFMILFKNTPFYNYTFITSERIADAILLFYLLFISRNNSKVKKTLTTIRLFNKYMLFQFFLLVYSAYLILKFGVISGLVISEDILNFIIFVPISVYGLFKLINSVDELMKILLCICLFQSFVVILGMSSPAIANYIDELPFNYNGGVYWTYSKYRELGYMGGIACVAAKGAIKLSLGMISCYYFICKKQQTLRYLIMFFIVVFASTAVARTGLVIGAIILLAIIIKLAKKKSGGLYFATTIIVVSILSIVTLVMFKNNTIPGVFSRLNTLFANGIYDSFLKHYFYGYTTSIPPITIETIIGTGITSGVSGRGIVINADGGFFRMYVALGLPLAIVFYCFTFDLIFKIMKKNRNNNYYILTFLFFIIFLISEFKEYEFYSRYFFVFFIVFSLLVEKERRTNYI